MNKRNNDRISARVNTPVKITLNSRGTAGYEWSPKYNSSALKLLKKNRIVNRKTFGGSGKIVFNFQTLAEGDHEITFTLQRPWEKKPVDKVKYLVHVD